MSSLRLALKQSLAESTFSHPSPNSQRPKNDRKRSKGSKPRRDRADGDDGNSSDEHEMDFAEGDDDHSSGSGMAEDEMSSNNGSDDEETLDKMKAGAPMSPHPSKKRTQKLHIGASRSFDGDDEQSGTGRGSDDESEEDLPIHVNDSARRSSHESASRQQQHANGHEGNTSMSSPLSKKKKKKKKTNAPSAHPQNRPASQVQARGSHSEGEGESEGNAMIKKKKKKRAPGTVSKPLPEVLSWVRAMSVNKQRRHVKIGHRIKVQFKTGTKKNGNRRLRWFGGEVLEVLPNGRRLRIRYRDGTIEVCDFPDNDIIVDADDNGQHAESAGGNDPARNPFLPRPGSPDDNDDDDSTSTAVETKKMRTKSTPTPKVIGGGTGDNAGQPEKRPIDETQLDGASGVNKPKKKKRKKLKHPIDGNGEGQERRPSVQSLHSQHSKHQPRKDGLPSSPITSDEDRSHVAPTADASSLGKKKKKKKNSKLRLKLSASKDSTPASVIVAQAASSSNDESGNQESDDDNKSTLSGSQSKKSPKLNRNIVDKVLTMEEALTTTDANAFSKSGSPLSSMYGPASARLVSTEIPATAQKRSLSPPLSSSPSKLRIKIGLTDVAGKSGPPKTPNTPRLQIDMKKILSPAGKKKSTPDQFKSSPKTHNKLQNSPGTPHDGKKQQQPELPFEVSKSQSLHRSPSSESKYRSSPSGERPIIRKGKTVSKTELVALDCMSPRGQGESQPPILTPGSLADAVKLGRHRVRKDQHPPKKHPLTPSFNKPKKRRRRVEEESPDVAESPGQESTNTIADENWVQCDSCQKWRLLPESVDMDALPERWYCELNKYDRKRMSCMYPEQTASDVLKERASSKLTPRKRRKKLVSPKSEKGSPPEVPTLHGETPPSNTDNRTAVASKHEGINLPMLPLGTAKSKEVEETKPQPSPPKNPDVAPVSNITMETSAPLDPRPIVNASVEEPREKAMAETQIINAAILKHQEKEVAAKPPKRIISTGSMKSKASKTDDDVICTVIADVSTSANTSSLDGSGNKEETAVAPRDKAKRRHRRKERAERDNTDRDRDNSEKNSDESGKEPPGRPTKNGSKSDDSQEWVQCEKCNKWRRLPPRIKAEDLPDEWYCTMNTWDIRVATCAAPEDFATVSESNRDNPNGIFGNEKSSASKLSYRNLIFGTAGRRQTRPSSERARAADSLFIAPSRDEASESHPTVQYSNSSCFQHRGMRSKSEEIDTSMALLELMSGTRLWEDLWRNAPANARPVTSSPTGANNAHAATTMYEERSEPETVVSTSTCTNGNTPEAINESMKALVYHAMGTHHHYALTRYEILLEVQCREWTSSSPQTPQTVSWASLRSACTLEWIDYCLSELVKDGLVQRVTPPDFHANNENAAPTSGGGNTANTRMVRYRRIAPGNGSNGSGGSSSSSHNVQHHNLGHNPTRCVKLAKPWKTASSKNCHYTDTQECEALLQQSNKRFEYLHQTLGPDPCCTTTDARGKTTFAATY